MKKIIIFSAIVTVISTIALSWYFAINVVQSNKSLSKASQDRNNLQDFRARTHKGHLIRHQRIINGYFKSLGIIVRPDTLPHDSVLYEDSSFYKDGHFWVGGYR